MEKLEQAFENLHIEHTLHEINICISHQSKNTKSKHKNVKLTTI